MSKNGANNNSLPAAPAAIDNELPRIEGLFVRNYRVLRNIHIEPITPLTAFVGPNGSGKSTIFDVLSFLSQCIRANLRDAWDSRGGLKELRTRGVVGPIVITLVYRERPDGPRMFYYLTLSEDRQGNPQVADERLKQSRRPDLLHLERGKGYAVREEDVIAGDDDGRVEVTLSNPDILGVRVFGLLADFPRLRTLLRLLTDWHLSSVSAASIRLGAITSRPDRLLPDGQNLAEVIQQIKEHSPQRFTDMLSVLTRWVPMLESLGTKRQQARWQLELKDRPFARPITDRFASEGTLKLLAHLALLYSADPPLVIGLEEPENYLHPRLLVELAEACRAAAVRSQILVSTHSPFFVDSLRPEEVWVLNRNRLGFTEVKRASDIIGIPEFMEHGAALGDLWMEGRFREPVGLNR